MRRCYALLAAGQLRLELEGKEKELQLARETHEQDVHSSLQLQELAAMLQESHRSVAGCQYCIELSSFAFCVYSMGKEAT